MKKLRMPIMPIFICLLSTLALFYTRPMTISEICLDIDIGQSWEIKGDFVIWPKEQRQTFRLAGMTLVLVG